MTRTKPIIIVAVALMLVVAGCTGADDGRTADVANDDAMDAAEEAAEEAADGETQGVSTSAGATTFSADADVSTRQLIRTGDAEIVVEAYDPAADEVRKIAHRHGGFVSDTAQRSDEVHNESWTRGEVTIRVPSDAFDDAFDEVTEIGEVTEASTGSEDVTDQLVDIEARLENLRAERDRLRELYEDANETEDVLAVQSELSSTQEEIERLEARQRSLSEQVAYATITVRITEEQPERVAPPGEAAWYDTGVIAAFVDSLGGVATALRALAVGAAYIAPYVLVFGTPVLLGGVIAWRRLDLDL